MDFPSFSQLFAAARVQALISNPQLTRDAIDREGSDANILIAAGAAIGDEVVGQLVSVTAGLYLESATGDALDRLMNDRYGLLRKTASAATGSVIFAVLTPNPADFTIPTGTQLGTAQGTRYETIEDVTFYKDAYVAYARIRSLDAGATTQASPGTITSLLSQVTGAPSDLSVTNTAATAGAADRESDTDYRRRGQQFFSTVQRGTLASLIQGALSVPGVATAAAFEGIDAAGNPAPYVTVIVTDQFTEALVDLSTVPPAYATQSQALAREVTAALNGYRPAGLFVDVRVASTLLQSVTLSLTYVGGNEPGSVSQAARGAIVNYINNLPAGAPLDPDALLAVLRTVSGLYVTGNEIVSPPGVVQPKQQQVLRSNMDLVRALSVDGILAPVSE